MKKVTFGMLVVTLVLFLGLNIFTDPIVANTVDKNYNQRDIYLNIMTCNKIQYNLVREIAGDKHNVEFMFNNNEESKDFRYTEETISNISNMDLFIYSGNEYEPWSKDLIDHLKKGNLGIINISRGMKKLTIESEEGTKENPYYWTGLDEYKVELHNIKNAIQDRDPKNRNIYEENYNSAVHNLEYKLGKIKENKESIDNYEFISLDSSLGYLYRTLGINPINISKDESLERVISQYDVKNKKILILKDKDTDLDLTGYDNVVEFNKFNDEFLADKLLVDNYKSFYYQIQNLKK